LRYGPLSVNFPRRGIAQRAAELDLVGGIVTVFVGI
jgi:hypothetical protein